jgi:hypothetical protein
MPFVQKSTLTPRINNALVEIERVHGFLDAVKQAKFPLTEKSHPATLSSEKQIPSAKSAKNPADSAIQTSGGEESLAAGGGDASAV